MLPNIKIKSLLAPAAIAVAAALSPTTASADAVAQSILSISDFRITADGGYQVITFSDSGDVSASINGGAAATDSANLVNNSSGFTLNQAVGPNAGSYSPLTPLTVSPTTNYVGSYSTLGAGDPLVAPVSLVAVDNTVSLTPGGSGTAQSNVNLTATYTIDVEAGTIFTVSFDADGYLRTMLDPFLAIGSSNASYTWEIIVTDLFTNLEVFSWSPDGSAAAGGIVGGTEAADAFDLNDASALNVGGFNLHRTGTGYFEASSNPFADGIYTLTINHLSNADATLRVPEPNALSLAALGLFGLGFIARRRRQK